MLTFEDHLEFLSVPELSPRSQINFGSRNVFLTAFSPNSDAALVVTKNDLKVFGINGKLIAEIPITGKDEIASATFSEDGKRIVLATKSGNVSVYDYISKTFLMRQENRQFRISDTYLSTNGNFFVTRQNENAALFNSLGKNIRNISNLPRRRGYELAGALFSLDGKDLILRYSYFSEREQLQQKQQQQKYEDQVYHFDLQTSKINQVYNSNFLSLLRLYSFTVSPTTLFDNGFILYGRSDGLIRRFDLRNGFKEELLAGNTDLVTSMSIRNNREEIMSSSKDGKTKMWVWDSAVNLERKKLLRMLSPEELKKLGVQ